MFIRLFYFLLFTSILVDSKIEIKDANVAALSRDEIGMIFYVTVQNSNTCPYEVKVNMIECTEILSAKDKDSSFMYLMGGYMGILKAHCFKNLTIIYPNMYLHNRRGYCLISLKFKSNNDDLIEKKANITFDTYISKKEVPTVMRGYFNKVELSRCSTPDQDSLNHCSPVDCHMKYLGTRNYFSQQEKRCLKVPLCINNPKKDMPNIIYSPRTNKCRNMEKGITKEDLESMESGSAKKCPEEIAFININCHFGKFNNETGSCDCFEGWTSAKMQKEKLTQAGLFVQHMCNIESNDWYDTGARKLKLICLIVGILAVSLAMVIILCAFLIQLCFNCIKTFEDYTSDQRRKDQIGKHNKHSDKRHKHHHHHHSKRDIYPSDTDVSTTMSQTSTHKTEVQTSSEGYKSSSIIMRKTTVQSTPQKKH